MQKVVQKWSFGGLDQYGLPRIPPNGAISGVGTLEIGPSDPSFSVDKADRVLRALDLDLETPESGDLDL